jgi:chaperonin GroEL
MKYMNGTSLEQEFRKAISFLREYLSLGPNGDNVLVQRKGFLPFFSRDGSTILRSLISSEPFQNLALETVKQASFLTDNQAGDGTTSTALLAGSFYLNSLKWLQVPGINPQRLISTISGLLDTVVSKIVAASTPIGSRDDIFNVANISVNGDRVLAKIITDVVENVGRDGSVIVEMGKGFETSIELIEGFRMDSGYLSPTFINDQAKNLARYDDAFILVSDYNFTLIKELLPILELVARADKPLIIISEDISGQALASLVANSLRGSLQVAAIKAPRFGLERESILKDLSIFLNCTFVSRLAFPDLIKVTLKDLGRAKTVELTKKWTTIVGGLGDLHTIKARIDEIKEQIKDAEIEEAKRLQERIMRLSSSVAIMKVGGNSEIEVFQKKLQIDDAIGAVKSAKEEGIVPGGCVALFSALSSLSEDSSSLYGNAALDILREAIYDLIRLLSKNAKISSEVILERMRVESSKGIGYDFRENRFSNLAEEGIVEPTKVVRCSLTNAFSVATALLTSRSAIVEEG